MNFLKFFGLSNNKKEANLTEQDINKINHIISVNATQIESYLNNQNAKNLLVSAKDFNKLPEDTQESYYSKLINTAKESHEKGNMTAEDLQKMDKVVANHRIIAALAQCNNPNPNKPIEPSDLKSNYSCDTFLGRMLDKEERKTFSEEVRKRVEEHIKRCDKSPDTPKR